MEYLPHQQRVIEERDSLQEKYDKLQNFFSTEIYKKLEDEDQQLLSDQHFHMGQYLAILKQRIERF